MPTFALNFYNPAVADQLRTGRKTATIRLGDKSAKYRKGMIVTVLCGARYGQRERIFDAVIDKVEVKALDGALAARDRARQPADPARRRDGLVPEPALQPRGRGGRDRHLIRFSQITYARYCPAGGSVVPKSSGVAHARAALLALDRESRRDRRRAGRAAVAQLAAALRSTPPEAPSSSSRK